MQYKHPSDYLIKEKRDARLWTVVSERDLVFEFMLNALRLTDGFSVHLFSERTLLPLSAMEPMLNQAKEKGLLQEVGGRIAATTLGQRFLNDAVSLFLPQED